MTTRPYRVERSAVAVRDLRAILSFLIKSYMQHGEQFTDAKAQAARRMSNIEAAMESLASLPHQGTLRANLAPGLRCVTKHRAIFYFTIDEQLRLVRVLAVFFGGQDHQRAMLKRVMREE